MNGIVYENYVIYLIYIFKNIDVLDHSSILQR